MKESIPLKWLIVLALAVIIGEASAQELKGLQVITPTANPACLDLNGNRKYMVQATLTTQDYTAGSYLFSSALVWNAVPYTASIVGAAPTDGGYVTDGGATFWQKLTPVILKDTDTYTWTVVKPYTSLCHQAGTTADGGVSAIKLNLSEVIPVP